MSTKRTTTKTGHSKKQTGGADTKPSNGLRKSSRKPIPKTANELMREAWEHIYANRHRRLDS